jgi:sulfur carrier protein ThiS
MSVPSSDGIVVRINLMGGLKELTPSDSQLELAAGAAISDVLAALNIDPAQAQIVLVNGRPHPDHGHGLSDQDELTVIPLVGGG